MIELAVELHDDWLAATHSTRGKEYLLYTTAELNVFSCNCEYFHFAHSKLLESSRCDVWDGFESADEPIP